MIECILGGGGPVSSGVPDCWASVALGACCAVACGGCGVAVVACWFGVVC
jgi:hypothetical protein